MSEVLTPRQAAIARCREAYAMNRIPWDRELERLPNWKLEETANYWERRFHGRDTASFNEPEYESPGPTLIGSTAGAIIAAQEVQYHGKFRPFHD